MQELTLYYLGCILSYLTPTKKNLLIMFFKSKSIVFASSLLALLSLNVNSTVVEVQTSMGKIEINLFDETTPKTVDNFLSYIISGSYADNIVHRSVSNFVIQGGGFIYTGPIDVDSFTLDRISTGTPIVNEPKLSNVRGTIAMAKGSNPDSATSQWFINLSDNSNSLDVVTNAGGFTVFGQVIGDGMQVVDVIAGLKTRFGEVPIDNYTDSDLENKVAITDDNLVVITDIVVIDPAVVTNSGLNPIPNTLINSSSQGDDSGGGGSVFWLALMALCSIQLRRCFK